MERCEYGRLALQRLRAMAEDASAIQRDVLLSIIAENAGTEFGQSHGFRSIPSVEGFQRCVPLSSYEDYESAVERIIGGERNILTASDPVYFAISSGSTDKPKYIPITEYDMNIHYKMIHLGIMGMLDEHFASSGRDILSRKVLQAGEFARTTLPSGQLCGVRSASIHQWLGDRASFVDYSYCVPPEVLYPESLVDLTYAKARFALAERDLSAIHSVFLHRAVGLLDCIRLNWDLLLHDMEHGKVDESISIPNRWRVLIERSLPPDPSRAAELRKLSIDSDPNGMVQRIWPSFAYFIGIGGANFPLYEEAMGKYAPGIPIHHYIYGASEGFLSIANGVDRPDEYMLIPEAGLFEFIPEEGNADVPLLFDGLEKGRRYELVFTNHSGLYRYRMKDVMEVVGFLGEAPLVRFCHRLNQALNVADEKMDSEQLAYAISLFAMRLGRSLPRYCVREDRSSRPGRYVLYLESTPVHDADRLMDECLATASYGYRCCRQMDDIARPCVRFLPHGTFRRYEEAIARTGRTMAQYKPLIVIGSDDDGAFFERQADVYEEVLNG